MADILIRGMDKPGGCADCDFCEIQDISFELFYYCNRTKRFIDAEEACNIPSDCPITELPEHGDLIDRGEILSDAAEVCEGCGDYAVFGYSHEQIKNATVIVPSNKEKTE